MTLLQALTMARDVASLSLIAGAALAALLALVGPTGLTGGLAASLATVAASSLVTFGVYGAFSSVGGGWIAPWVGVAAAFGAILIGLQLYGVRGLWVGALIAAGVGLGALFLALVGARTEGPLGAAAPALAFAALALLATGGLAATVRIVQSSPNLAHEASKDFWRPAQVVFATPPDWFDCAFAALGGAAARPGFCAFNAPETASTPPWSAPLVAPPQTDVAPTPPANPTTSLDVAQDAAPTPRMGVAPDSPAVDTPDFDAIIRAEEDVAPTAPGGLAAALAPNPLAGLGATSGPASQASAPNAASIPGAMGATNIEAQPSASRDGADASVLARVDAPTAPDERAREIGLNPLRPERTRTQHICFPMVGVLADQLCPDTRLSAADVSVAWRTPGGDALGAVERVECFVDPGQTTHATLFLALDDGLLGRIDRTANDDRRAQVAKIDAIYETVTRLVGAARARASGDDDGALLLSSYVAGGAALRSPWAALDFGAKKSDRVFDVRSGAHTLALLKRLKSESQGLRAGGSVALDAALEDLIATAPTQPNGGGQTLIIAFVDAATTQSLSPEAVDRLAPSLARGGAPLFLIELGAIAPSEQARQLATASNGVAFAARDAARLAELVDQTLERARNFCAVGVTAPETFFAESALEVKLRRQMTDGCVLEQIAVLDCQGLSLNQRIQPRR